MKQAKQKKANDRPIQGSFCISRMSTSRGKDYIVIQFKSDDFSEKFEIECSLERFAEALTAKQTYALLTHTTYTKEEGNG